MTKIFLSYRRADSDVIVGRIRDRLANTYGEKSVFMDVDNIPFGVDFRSHVKESLLHGDLLIAVVGPNWLGRDEHGRSRLEEEADPVRLELEAALERKMPIIPVLVHGAKMPVAKELPPSLNDFAFFNAANVDVGRDFHPHLERLIRTINPLLKRSSLRRPAVWAAGLLVLLLTGAAAFFLGPPGSAVISKQRRAAVRCKRHEQKGISAANHQRIFARWSREACDALEPQISGDYKRWLGISDRGLSETSG
jgi:hypothetical protein